MNIGYQRGKRGRKPKYSTEEERRAALVQNAMRWNRANKERVAEYKRSYYERNRERVLQRAKERYRAKVARKAAKVACDPEVALKA